MALDSLRFAHRFDQISGSAIREIFKMIAKPGMISFAGGNPAASALRIGALYDGLAGMLISGAAPIEPADAEAHLRRAFELECGVRK